MSHEDNTIYIFPLNHQTLQMTLLSTSLYNKTLKSLSNLDCFVACLVPIDTLNL